MLGARQTGFQGEEIAAGFLQDKGWELLARNWRHGSYELDLVCRDGDTVVFVEVKTRDQGGLTRPDQAFTREKQRRMIKAAQYWLAEHKAWSSPCRFDLVCVNVRQEHYQTELISHVVELGQTSHRGHAAWQPW